MARNDTGKWVARAAATGGGRTYRGQRPVKWYGSLVVICVLGLSLVWFSRYERQHPSSAGQPTVGTRWVAALSFDICGTTMANLPPNPNLVVTPGINTQGDGLIHISPTNSSEAGANATLGRFVKGYRGLELTSTTLRYPGRGSSTAGRRFTDSQRCPSGTPRSGQQGEVQVQVYPSFTSTAPTQVSDPQTWRLGQGQLITVAFLPHGSHIPRPPASTIQTLERTISTLNSGRTSSTTIPSTSVPTSGTTPSGGGSGSSLPSGTTQSTAGGQPHP